MTNSDLDFSKWGGLVSETSNLDTIQTSDGVHIKHWKGSIIVYRITNANLIATSKTMLVGLNASISARGQKSPPFFTGGGKATNIRSPILSISDSTTHTNDVALGWYLGTEEDPNFQKCLSEFIEAICQQCELNPVLFGGSGGGFASVVLGDMLDIDSIVIAMNPQTDVVKWHPRHVQEMYSKQWNCSSVDEFESKLESHGIVSNFSQLRHNSKSDVLILQNFLDEFQMVHHFPLLDEVDVKLASSVGSTRNIRWFFGIWGPGHFAPWPEHVRESLQIATDESSTLPVINFLKNQFYPEISRDLIIKVSDISLSGGGMFGDFQNLLLYRARSDLTYQKIPIYGYRFSNFDASDRNLAFCIHSLRQIDFLFRNKNISEFAIHLAVHHILDWWEFVNSGIGQESVMAWYDMSSGLRAQKLALILSLMDSVPALEKYRPIFNEIAEEHIRWFGKPGFVKNGNHGIFQIHGYMALSLALNLEDDQRIAIKMMNDIFNSQFSSNLMHVENSPEYHQFVISIFDSYFNTNWYGEDISKKLERAKILNYWLVDTESKYFCVGDTEPKPLNLSESIKLQAIKSADQKIVHRDQVYHVKSFDETGYLCLKSDEPKGNVFFSLSAFPSIGHRQADDLSFVLFDQGQWRFDDPGKYTYQRDKRRYIDKTHQHNSLTIDDNSYSVKSDSMYRSCRDGFEYDQDAKIFSTSMRWSPVEGVNHIRYCMYAPSEFFVVVDQLISNEEHKYSQWFQIGQSYKEFEQIQSSIRLKSKNPDVFQMDFYCLLAESNVRTYFGDHTKPVGWISKQYQKLEENLAIEHEVIAKSATLCAISSFSTEISSDEIFERIDKLGLEITSGSLRN